MRAYNNYNDEWINLNRKPLRHPDNREFITARANIIHGKKVIRISIGLSVCEILDITEHDRVNLYIHKTIRNFLLVCKDKMCISGYKLTKGHKNANFLVFDFRYDTEESFRLSQTQVVDFDFNDEGLICIDIKKIVWSK